MMNEGLSTRCVHAGEIADAHGSPHTPIYNTTTFKFPTTADLLDVVDGRKPGSLYTRYGLNPTIQALEAKLASLEGAEMAWAFCSGMAAEAALFFAHGREGIVCLGDAYGGTLELLGDQIGMLGTRTHLLLGSELDLAESRLADGCGLVFLETPTNPTLEVLDIRRIADMCHRHAALLAVDNTFASPVNQSPLALGADFVVHSATKYLGGHSDLTAGVLAGRKDLMMPVWAWRKNLGSMIAPETAALLSRSLRTLVVRVERQNRTARAVAEAMAKHEKVARVYFPGLPGFPGHELARAQMRGFGGMLSIEVAMSLPIYLDYNATTPGGAGGGRRDAALDRRAVRQSVVIAHIRAAGAQGGGASAGSGGRADRCGGGGSRVYRQCHRSR
jgi:cystathionine gamma-synthase